MKSYRIIEAFAIINLVLLARITYAADAPKEKEDTISDAELDEMLKDPKYAALLGGSADELLKASPATKPSDKSQDSHPSKSKQATAPELGSTSFLKSMKDNNKIDTSLLDSLKDLDSPPIRTLPPKPKKEEPPVEDKFQTYDFISKQQARYLIEILKQPVFYNMLPSEAKDIVKVTRDNFQFKLTQDGKIDDFIETNMTNTPNSQSFVDPDGQIGRKGILTIIDPINSNSKFAWAVSNSKTLTLFESQSFLVILKLYRNSALQLKDIPVTPCFLISNVNAKSEGSLLLCTTSTQEKEIWIQTITSTIKRFTETKQEQSNNSFLYNSS